MRTRTLNRAAAGIATPPLEAEERAVAGMVDGALWSFIDRLGLFLRLAPGDVPERFHTTIGPDTMRLIRTVVQDKGKRLPLPATVDPPTIGSTPVNGKVMRLITGKHEDVTWHADGNRIVARSGGEVVAFFPMPKGTGMMDVTMAEHDGDMWACHQHGFFRIKPPPEMEAKIRAGGLSRQNAEVIRKVIEAATGGTVVEVRTGDDGTWIGPVEVPTYQYTGTLGACGTNLVWRFFSPTTPVIAFKDGRVVAAIMPMVPYTAGGEA